MDVFPFFKTVSLLDAKPGSIVRIARNGASKVVLVTDHITNGVRSFVWLNPGFRDRPPAIFAEKWRNDPSVLQYANEHRFEFGTEPNELDPTGRNSWRAPGAIVSIADDLFIWAALEENEFGRPKLVNIRSGSVHPDALPETLWTFLSWQLWIRDPLARRDLMVTQLQLTNPNS